MDERGEAGVEAGERRRPDTPIPVEPRSEERRGVELKVGGWVGVL